MKKIPEIIKENNPLSDELYDLIMKKAKEDSGYNATPWIHLADAVSRGTITPLEAYNALFLGYLPEYLTIRCSNYQHLL